MEEVIIFEKLLFRDLVKYIILPYVFEVCYKCGRYLRYEEEVISRKDPKGCYRCMFSICENEYCTRRGTKYDFHYKNYGYPALRKWLCSKHFVKRRDN